jgi:Mg2+-importing ATPase
VLLNQIRNPLLLVLVFAAGASAFTGEWIDASIVLAIVLATVTIGYAREYSAHTAAAALQARIRPLARVVRDGEAIDVPAEDLVPVMSCSCPRAASFRPTVWRSRRTTVT